MSEEVRNNFTEKKKCLIEQYNQYEEPGIGLHLDGKRTSFENFADNMGIRLAYRAYRGWNEKFTGKRQSLIGLQYTWDQLFWISAGQTWCGVYREGFRLFNSFRLFWVVCKWCHSARLTLSKIQKRKIQNLVKMFKFPGFSKRIS